MDQDLMSSGKYKKLSAAKKEQQYLKDHPAAESVKGSILQATDSQTSSTRRTWYAGQSSSTSVNESEQPDGQKRASEDLACIRASNIESSSSTLRSSDLNKSAPQLSVLSTEQSSSNHRAKTPPPSPDHTLSSVKLRDKSKKTSSGISLNRRANKATSAYGSEVYGIKKPRPKSTIFSNSIMRRPRNSINATSVSLLDTLDNKKLRTAFLDFLESEYSSENLSFWLSCEKFRKMKNEDQREKEGRYIYSQYISSSAPHQINIDHVTRRQITIKLTGCDDGLASDVFDHAQRYVFSIMENDSFPRFLSSSYYKEAASKKNAFESVLNILPGNWNNSGSTSPTKSQNKLKNCNNNNSKNEVFAECDQGKQNATVSRRFSFGFKKNYATKPVKGNRSSAPELTTDDGFYHLQLKVA